MYYGLRHWEEVQPNVLDIPGAGARIDLSRADQLDTVNGWAIVQQDTPIGSDGIDLGQGDTLRDVLAGQAVKDAWFAAVGTRPDGDTLDQLLFDHLESKADPTGTDTARPLELADGRLEVWLGIRQRHIVPFANGTTQERAAFVRMVQRIRGRLDEARALSQAGTLPADLYRKLLTVEARKIGVNPTSLRPKKWAANESPIEPTTTVTDSFSSMGSFTKVTGAGTWTANTGLYVYRDPASAVLDTIKHNTAMSANDNWADLVIPLTQGAALGNGSDIGPICRLGGSGSRCYCFSLPYTGGTGANSNLIRFGASSNTTTVIAGPYFFYVHTFSPNVGLTPTMRVKAVGSTITGYAIGNSNTLSTSATDTNNASGLYTGFGCTDSYGSGYATIKVASSFTGTDGVAAAPTVSNISPSTGSTAGGLSVTITGTGFSGSTVTIGGASATGVSVVSSTVITCTTPAGTAGAKDVVVTNGDSQTGTLTNGFTYVAPSGASSATHSTGRRR